MAPLRTAADQLRQLPSAEVKYFIVGVYPRPEWNSSRGMNLAVRLAADYFVAWHLMQSALPALLIRRNFPLVSLCGSWHEPHSNLPAKSGTV